MDRWPVPLLTLLAIRPVAVLSFKLYHSHMKKPVTKKVAPKKPKRQAAHVSVNQNEAEPMHILGPGTRRPEVGDVLKVLPDRFQRRSSPRPSKSSASLSKVARPP